MLNRLVLLSRRSPGIICSVRSAHHGGTHDIEKIPPHFRNITYDDVPFPRGSWQARYEELEKKRNSFLALALGVTFLTLYGVYQTHEWIGQPDEPAERWYPLDRFKDGDGKSVV